MASPEELAEYKEAFSLFDRNGDGVVDAKDIPLVVRSLGYNPTEQEVAAYKDMDFPGFLAALEEKLKTTRPDKALVEAFRIFDRENNGTISAAELMHVMKNLGEVLSEAEVDQMIKEADPSGSGNIKYADFVRLLLTKS